ncbi:cytochrome P450 [Microdochium bolleyi]|uniref:Cytochrome P450 n=1 Tax=Microdochium bolleyi TaxID=196109 RepID=A0A136IJI4_9PEZI|nr:cytochrome P450 [Microdochium bolleyi]
MKPPKGPRPLPIIGNLHQIPRTGAHRLSTKWSKTYGGIFTLYFGRKPVVIITDRRLVRELIDKKSRTYSDRPELFVTQDLITKGDHLSVMRYGPKWRLFRKLVHQHVSSSQCERNYIQMIEAEETQMMRDFLVNPQDFMLHPKRTSNSVIMSVAYGLRSESYCTSHVTELYDMMDRFSALLEPGALPPVDMFPLLRLLPESWFRNWVQKCTAIRLRMKKLYSGVLSKVLDRRIAHITRSSAIDYVLDRQNSLSMTQNQLEFIGGVFQEGGSETIASTMIVVIQALALNPQIQRAAQKEIDAVIGEDRSPVWLDYDRLPYVTMIIKEAFRWRPIAPLAFPHALTSDDTIDGYLLPRGAVIFINHAASPDYVNKDRYGYGAGRRICPGIHLAEREMFVGIAKLIWAFDFGQKLDNLGSPIPIDTNPETCYSEGILVSPKDFECSIVPRSEARAQTILREYDTAVQTVFPNYQS